MASTDWSRQHQKRPPKLKPVSQNTATADLSLLFAGAPEFLVTPLLKGPVCLISQGQFVEPVRPWLSCKKTNEREKKQVKFLLAVKRQKSSHL